MISPYEVELHRSRAAALQTVGRHQEAIMAMRHAVGLSPGAAALRMELGQLLAGAGQVEDAIAAFAQATDLQPDLAQAWYFLGMTLYAAQRDAEALPALQQAQRLLPEQPQILRALAETEYALEQYDDAAAHYQQIDAAGPLRDPAVRLRLAQSLRKAGRPHEALTVVAQAIARFQSDASLWMESGWIHEDLGDAASAQAAYARAHALRPEWADPVAASIALSGITADGGMLQVADGLLNASATPEPQRAFLHYVLGKHADRGGLYAEAATHWAAANRLRRQLDGGFDREAFHLQIDEAIAAFDARNLQHSHTQALRDERPVFVVGMPRSGTTLVEQMIAAHPSAHGCGELTGIVAIANDIPKASGLRWPQDMARVESIWLRERAQNFIGHAAKLATSDTRRLIDKQPYNFLHVGLIAMLFADAKIIWCRRDPRDISLSIYGENFSRSAAYATDLGDIQFVIDAQERLMRHWQAVSPLQIRQIAYETLVSDPEAGARELIDFVGLPWDAACLEFHRGQRAVQTPSRWQVRQPIHHRSVGRWRNYPAWFAGETAGI